MLKLLGVWKWSKRYASGTLIENIGIGALEHDSLKCCDG